MQMCHLSLSSVIITTHATSALPLAASATLGERTLFPASALPAPHSQSGALEENKILTSTLLHLLGASFAFWMASATFVFYSAFESWASKTSNASPNRSNLHDWTYKLAFTSLKAPILKVCMQETCGRQMKWVYNCSEWCNGGHKAGYRDRESAEHDPGASLWAVDL